MTLLAAERVVHLDQAKLMPAQLQMFEEEVSGQKVRFVVQRTLDNKVHVALATCRACYHSMNPHYTRKGKMICGKCNMPMQLESAMERDGNNRCTLPEIPHQESVRDVTVHIRDVLAQAQKVFGRG